MLINDKSQKVEIILSDGRVLESAEAIECIVNIADNNKGQYQSGPFEYIMVRGYRADADKEVIKRVVEVELDLLKKLQKVCEKHNLKLYMVYGTLLGAVRHGGVIPGDDDIDVALLREDYDKLLHLIEEFDGQYFLQTIDTDDAFFGGYIKLRNVKTTAVHEQNRWTKCVEGIGIDIFPIDVGFKNSFQEKVKLRKVCFYQRLLYAWVYGEARNYKDMPLLIWKMYKYLGKCLGKDRIEKGLNNALRQGDKTNIRKMGIYSQYSMGKSAYTFSSFDFKSGICMKYEDMFLLAPGNYKELLKRKYGEDYMSIPIQENVVKRRHGLYDVDRSYLEYQSHVVCFFSRVPKNKDIILIGDRILCSEYVKERMPSYPAAYWIEVETVNYDKIERLNKEKMLEESKSLDLVERQKIDVLKEIDYEKVFPFVCVFDYKKGFDLMRDAGCNDYFFYHCNAEWMRTSDPFLEARAYLATKGLIQEEN